MPNVYRNRRSITVFISIVILLGILVTTQMNSQSPAVTQSPIQSNPTSPLATVELEKLVVKGRAPKTDYNRSQFGDGWITIKGCDTRILFYTETYRPRRSTISVT